MRLDFSLKSTINSYGCEKDLEITQKFTIICTLKISCKMCQCTEVLCSGARV